MPSGAIDLCDSDSEEEGGPPPPAADGRPTAVDGRPTAGLQAAQGAAGQQRGEGTETLTPEYAPPPPQQPQPQPPPQKVLQLGPNTVIERVPNKEKRSKPDTAVLRVRLQSHGEGVRTDLRHREAVAASVGSTSAVTGCPARSAAVYEAHRRGSTPTT